MVVALIFVRVSVMVTVAPAAAAPFESVIVPSNEPLTACPTPTVKTLTQINASNKSLFDMPITFSWLKVAFIEQNLAWFSHESFAVGQGLVRFIYLWQFANASTGRLRYGTGSGSDLAPPEAAATEAPGRYRSLYRNGDRATFPYTQSQYDLGLSGVIARNQQVPARAHEQPKQKNEKE